MEIFNTLSESEPIQMMGQPHVIWYKVEVFQMYSKWGNKCHDWSSGVLITNAGHGRKVIYDALKKVIDQHQEMFFEGNNKSGMIKYNDQFREVEHSYLDGIGCAGSHFNFVSPYFNQLVPWEGERYKLVGYGFESVAATINMDHKIENEVEGLSNAELLIRRRKLIRSVDEKGIIATPANSFVNELVVEAARLSILNDGDMVIIEYGKNLMLNFEKTTNSIN